MARRSWQVFAACDQRAPRRPSPLVRPPRQSPLLCAAPRPVPKTAPSRLPFLVEIPCGLLFQLRQQWQQQQWLQLQQQPRGLRTHCRPSSSSKPTPSFARARERQPWHTQLLSPRKLSPRLPALPWPHRRVGLPVPLRPRPWQALRALFLPPRRRRASSGSSSPTPPSARAACQRRRARDRSMRSTQHGVDAAMFVAPSSGPRHWQQPWPCVAGINHTGGIRVMPIMHRLQCNSP